VKPESRKDQAHGATAGQLGDAQGEIREDARPLGQADDDHHSDE